MPGELDYQGAIAIVRHRPGRLLLPGRVGDHDVPDRQDAVQHDASSPTSSAAAVRGAGRLAHARAPEGSGAHRRQARPRPRRSSARCSTRAAPGPQGGHVPAWLPFRNSAAYDEADAAVELRGGGRRRASTTRPAWYSGSGSDFEIIIGSTIGAVMAGQLVPGRRDRADARSKLTVLAKTPVAGLRASVCYGGTDVHAGNPRRHRRELRQRGRQRLPANGATRRRPAIGLCLAPFLILYLLFVIGPALYGLVMSFFDTSLVQAGPRQVRRRLATTPRRSRARTSGRRCGTRSGSRS